MHSERTLPVSNIADLRIELRSEAVNRRRSLVFWESQPETPVWPASGFSENIRAGRIEALKVDIQSIEHAITVVDDALAKGY